MQIRNMLLFWVANVMVLLLLFSIDMGLVQAKERSKQPKDAQGSSVNIEISWKDVAQLIDTHPMVAAGKMQVAAARAELGAAGAVPNPSVEGTAAYGNAHGSPAQAGEWGVSLSMPFDWIIKRGAKIDVAGAQVRVSEAEAELLRRDVLSRLQQLFWNLVYEQARVAAFDALNKETKALLRSIEKRVQRGESRPVEQIRFKIEAEKVAAELAMAQAELESQQEQLKLWLDLSDSKSITAKANLFELPRPLSAKAARAIVRNSHPAIRTGQAKIQELNANVALERRARIPTFSLQTFTDHEPERVIYGVGLAVDFPLWNWNSQNIRKAKALFAAENSRLNAQSLTLEASVVDAQAACKSGVILAERYRDIIQPSAISAAQIIEKSYELGEATLLEVLDARRTLLKTRTQTLSVLAKAQIECSRLNVLAGEELP